MKRLFSITVLTVLLMACAAEKAPVVVSGAQMVSNTEFVGDVGGYLPLPAQMALEGKYHLRSDRIFVNKKGATRRRVIFEMMDADMDASVRRVERMMLAGEYVGTAHVKGKKDTLTIPFRKANNPTIRVKFNPSVGKKPANPDAKHLVAIEWQVKAAEKDKRAK